MPFLPLRTIALPDATNRVFDAWRGCRDLNRWLAAHVGPSQAPPDDGRW